jgi:hypothetical protein
MAVSGFFLGGMAEGKAARDALDIRERETDIRQQEADTRAEGLRQSRDNLLRSEVDKAISNSVQTVTGIINESRPGL